MVMTTEQRHAWREVVQRYDYLEEQYACRDFIEIIGVIGGDVERVRIYKDGTVCHK